jgi:hypothetical protein
MKLPDFTLHSGLNELRKQMRAELVELIQEDPDWQRISIELAREGIDVTFDEVEIQSDSTFEYRGQKVVVYIRDQHANVLDKHEYKFHVAQCDTLDSMQRRNRGNRYVVTNRKDGQFVVNVISKSKGRGETFNKLEKPMRVCKNCLYSLGLLPNPDKFSLEDFFRKYSSRIKHIPQHTEKTAPVNIYPPDWRDIANRRKKENNWQCQACKRSFFNQKELLHVHHVDGDKTNNYDWNLHVLCATCHAHQPGHEHMKPMTPKIPNFDDQAP